MGQAQAWFRGVKGAESPANWDVRAEPQDEVFHPGMKFSISAWPTFAPVWHVFWEYHTFCSRVVPRYPDRGQTAGVPLLYPSVNNNSVKDWPILMILVPALCYFDQNRKSQRVFI